LLNSEINKKKSSLDTKLPIIPDQELAKILHSNISSRIYSANTFNQNNRFLNKNYKYKRNVYDVNYGNRFLKIPKLKHRRGNKSLDNSSNLSNTGNDSPKCEKNNFKKKNSNIINIVNNVNGHKDKNNKIGLKVNINRYDIKYYVPQKCDEQIKKIKEKSESENETSKSSQEIYFNNQLENSDFKSNDINDKNGINVDIINFSRKSTNKIKDKERSKEDIKKEKKIRGKILNKIKSLNNVYCMEMGNHRPKLDIDDIDIDPKERGKMIFKKYRSKELNYNKDNHENIKFDDTDSSQSFEDENDNNIKKKSNNIYNKNIKHSETIKEVSNNMSGVITENSVSSKYSIASTSSDKIEENNFDDFYKNKNKTNKQKSLEDFNGNKNLNQKSSDSSLINEKDYEKNDSNINYKDKYFDLTNTKKNIKDSNINITENNETKNQKNNLKDKERNMSYKISINDEEIKTNINIRKKEINENKDEIGLQANVTPKNKNKSNKGILFINFLLKDFNVFN